MKKYEEYMDDVSVSDTLHEKLKHLEPAKKQPVWQRYAAVAAAVVLVLGLGAFGLTRNRDALLNSNELGQPEIGLSEPAIGQQEPAETGEPAVAPVPVPLPNSPGMEMMGGYEVQYGEGENATVAYYYLPLIRYGEVQNEVTADIALPVGVYRRDLTDDELLALLGGETNLVSHLNWAGYEVSAYAMLNRDGSLWLLGIHGSKGDTGLEYFSLEVSPDQLPPSCLHYAQGELNNVWEREVYAECHDGDAASSRRVSFMDRGYGYRFEITGADKGTITDLVSRMVRFIIVGDGLTFEAPSDTAVNSETSTLPYDPSAEPMPTPTVEP